MSISNERSIDLYMHCSQCIKELQKGKAGEVSPEQYSKLSIGWTKLGLQVWCNRHDCNVVHINFEGRTHPANTTIKTEGKGP